MITELEKHIFELYYESKDKLTIGNVRSYWEYLHANHNDIYRETVSEYVDLGVATESQREWIDRGYSVNEAFAFAVKAEHWKAFKCDLEQRLSRLDPEDFEETVPEYPTETNREIVLHNRQLLPV